MVKKAVLKKVQEFVRELRRNKIKVSRAILYGSQATGKAHEYSDIDVAIVSPSFGKDRYEEGAMLFEIAGKIDPLIEPVPISTQSYKNDTWVPLIYEIRKNGIEVI
ncbi:MAG TPA: nucleotidyltransferase domain-containing protein [Dissulfurispiraceae bacterium]